MLLTFCRLPEPSVALLSETTAKEVGAVAGGRLTVSTDRGSITLPLAIVDLPERVVWCSSPIRCVP